MPVPAESLSLFAAPEVTTSKSKVLLALSRGEFSALTVKVSVVLPDCSLTVLFPMMRPMIVIVCISRYSSPFFPAASFSSPTIPRMSCSVATASLVSVSSLAARRMICCWTLRSPMLLTRVFITVTAWL